MHKKNLIILFIMPFVIALISVVTINRTFTAFYKDIEIEWAFGDLEAVKYTETLELKAWSTLDTKNLAPGNEIVFSVANKDSSIEEPIAEVINENGKYFLKAHGKGEVILTVSNEKGNKFKKTTIVFYENGAILITPKIESSQKNIDSTIYYGLYDYDDSYNKVNATIDFNVLFFPSELASNVEVNCSSNLNVKLSSNEMIVKAKGIGDSYISLIPSSSYEIDNDARYDFAVVDAINIYNYNQLLEATNRSAAGEAICLRKNFLSESQYSISTRNNNELFGNYDTKAKSYNFSDEVYRYETTFNREFIDQWNNFANSHRGYSKISSQLACGLHIKKDVYGNGYSINMHNLTYPSGKIVSGGIESPTPLASDIFQGPLIFYCLGDPNGFSIVKAYGQDNAGIYIDANDVTINDLIVSNCDTPASLSFLNYVGNVVDIHGNNVTIKNSQLQNGKSVLRAFSSQNLVVDNCLLSTSYNFLIVTGANEYEKIDSRLTSLFEKSGQYDNVLNEYLLGNFEDKASMRSQINDIQTALNNENTLNKNNFIKGSMTINDTYFYKAGLSCICFESLFNGPYLFGGSPSFINEAFSIVNDKFKSVMGLTGDIIPFTPTNVSGMSYPVTVSVTGDTRFYDYKDISEMDLNGLIDENISELAEMAGKVVEVSVDDIFPLRKVLNQKAKEQGCLTAEDSISYVNIPVCYYGGGLNISSITIDFSINEHLKTFNVDFAANYMNLPGVKMSGGSFGIDTSDLGAILGIAQKCVVVSTGFEPFKFSLVTNSEYLFNESPNISELINRA